MEYTYEDDIRITSEFLDKIDILKFIHSGKLYEDTLYKVMERIGYTVKAPDDDFFEGDVFNRMNESEFEDYLLKRYGKEKIFFNEVTTTYIMKL